MDCSRRKQSWFYNSYEQIPIGYIPTCKILFIVPCVLLRLGEMYRSICQPSFIHISKNKIFFLLIIEEMYCVILHVHDENCPGLITIMNRFYTDTKQHAKQCSSIAG
jgi:hypothetical protein